MSATWGSGTYRPEPGQLGVDDEKMHTGIYLPRPLWDRLTAHAQRCDEPRTWTIRRAITALLEREEGQ